MAKKEATATVSPQMPDEPKDEATVAQAPNPSQNAGNTDAELSDVMDALKRYDLDSPEKVENVVMASQQTGRTAQLLGEQRKLVDQLTQQVEELKGARTSGFLPEYEEQPVDLKGLVRGELADFWNGIQKQQADATQRQWEAYSEIQTDEDYNVVKDAWEVYVRQPNVAYSFQTGATDPVKEYNKFVRKFQRKLLHRTKGLLEQVTQRKKIEPPFMEHGTNTPEMPKDPTETSEKLKEIKTKYKGVGSEAAMEDILDTLIPAGDPLLARR